MINNDPHHCHCFSLNDESDFDLLKDGLEGIAFNEPLLQENRGQIFGMTKRLDEYTQMHIKLLGDGTIEGEIEYPPDYPFAHINQEYSYSAHDEVQEVLQYLGIPYSKKLIPPLSCVRRKIVKAVEPTPAKTIVGAALAVAAIGILAYAVSKSSKG